MFLKFRDILHETVSEYTRRGEFVRIFPAKNSKIYDKLIYKTLFSSEFLPYGVNLSDLIQNRSENLIRAPIRMI